MKRHESITALSRDHHTGLLFCWKIRQGIKKDIPLERMQKYVQFFQANHLEKHFEEEETMLFVALQHPLIETAMAEHQEIRELIKSGDDLSLLADQLEKHIRFEERTLFPFLEKELPEEVLADIGQRIQQVHGVTGQDNYTDEFWV